MKNEPPPSIYFGGCGYGLPYYFGVYKAMTELWGPDFQEKTILCGDGVGSIMAICITMKYSPDFIAHIYCNMSQDIFENPDVFEKFCLKPLLRGKEKSLEIVNDKCLLGTSTFFAKHIWRTHWDDEDELLRDLRNSIHIPVLFKRSLNDCGVMEKNEIVDGTYCLTGRELPHGNDTLCIGTDSTFEIPVPLSLSQMMFVQKGNHYQNLVEEGHRAFLQWNGIMNSKVENKRPNYIVHFVLWILKFLELLIEFAKFYEEIVM